MEIKKINLGDTVRMKKKHPCGSWEWVVTRVGADIKIRCCGCGHMVMMARAKFEKSMAQVVTSEHNSSE
ncbi:MAG: DUF951 domain-containing protein [Syntrophomonadaceae bacterium]|nr:DUF951 domain-containing protein [Syntrophomonadaceae bacterium]